MIKLNEWMNEWMNWVLNACMNGLVWYKGFLAVFVLERSIVTDEY